MSRKSLFALSVSMILLCFYCFIWFSSEAQAQNARPVLMTQSVDESKLVTLSGNTRPEAKKQNDRGLVADSFPMEHMLLQLKRSPEQERELLQLIDDLHNSSLPTFHHWLTAKEFGKRFGLANQDLDTITRWLQSHGFNVNVVYENGLLIDFSGTADQVRAAFHTEIHELDVKGAKHFANMSDPKIPAALAPAVAGVVSLHDFKPHTMHKPRANYTAVINGSTYQLVTPADLATIYNFNPLFSAGISGKGQTIVVIEDSDVYSTADWTTFRKTFGLSSYTSGSFTEVHPAPPSGTNNCVDPGLADAEGEAILDAEYASASAPSAAIELASCEDTSTFGGFIALSNLLNESKTPPAVISISYGECEAYNGTSSNAAYSAAYQQAVTEGVSVFVSSGDEGAASCDANESYATHGIGVSGFTSTPYNVSVGGTDFGDSYAGTNSTYWNASNASTYESAKSYIPEIPWNDSCASVLIATVEGYSTTYGSSGFCNSSTGEADFITTASGSGGPSGCATGTPTVSGVAGGTCAGWPKPSWQSLVGVPNDNVRDIPDVSLFAANGIWGHWYPFCDSFEYSCTGAPATWSGAGGTSFASPIMAGIQALVNEKSGERQGNPNPVYYSLAASEYGASGDSSCNSTLGNGVSSTCIFYDVTQGDMDVPCYDGDGTYDCYTPSGTFGVLSTSNSSYQMAYGTSTGWDFATGIGTVNAANLVNSWPTSSPSFTLSAAPATLSIAQGASGTSTITITPANSFSGSVTLAASGLPKGVTAAFNPSPATSTSAMAVTASSTATAGTATVTITGTSGSLSATTTIALTVTKSSGSGNFTLTAAPKTLTVAQGASGTSTITIKPTGSFAGNVTLVATGVPSGVTASFSSNPATSTSTLTLAVSGSATVGTATITITGTSGSLSHTATVKLKVVEPNFTLTASPKTLAVAQGSSGTSTITIKPTNTFDQKVTLTASGLPSGVTASFSPEPATSSSTLTLKVGGSAAAGKSTITITGTSGSVSHTTTVKLTVSE